jgi:8-oxo-dGTP pyrophosphatase MutT (NUDIX family)
MVASIGEQSEINDLLKNWRNDPRNVKTAFFRLRNKLASKANSVITFRSRPGVSYSMRVNLQQKDEKGNRHFVLVDIIDDDPDNRWLSVCFYEDTISDDEERGERIPDGILGEDGYCFDLFENDESLLLYLEKKIDEAHINIMTRTSGEEEKDPKIPRPASTIILVREYEGSLQIYLLQRSHKSTFFPGFYVFPGGVVDVEDRDVEIWQNHVDLGDADISLRFNGRLSKGDALAFGVSAIRETFEEAGVMLAKGDSGRQAFQRIIQKRNSHELVKGWLREWATAENIILSLSQLSRWAHWITPERFKSRFDTRFFMAHLPFEQECSPDARETTHGIWLTPEAGLTGNQQGEIPLSPPTIVTLHELLPYSTMKELKKALITRLWGEARLPRLIPLHEGAIILQPWDPMLHEDPQHIIDNADLSIAPVGEPFSRLWLHNGLWRPIRYE